MAGMPTNIWNYMNQPQGPAPTGWSVGSPGAASPFGSSPTTNAMTSPNAQPQAPWALGDPVDWGGLGSNLSGFIKNNPALITQLAAGLMAGPTLGQGMAKAFGGMNDARALDTKNSDTAKQKATLASWLATNGKDLDPATKAALSADPALAQAYFSQNIMPKSEIIPDGGVLTKDGKVIYENVKAPTGKADDNWVNLVTPQSRSAAGIDPQNRLPFQMNTTTGELKQIGSTGSTTNVNLPGTDATADAFGRKVGEDIYTTLQSGTKAQQTLGKLNSIQKIAAGMKQGTGPLTPGMATMGGVLQQLGLDPQIFGIDKALPTTVQALEGLTNSLLAGLIGTGPEAILPANTFTEKDREVVRSIIATTSDLPGAFDLKLRVMQAAQQAAADRAEMLRNEMFSPENEGKSLLVVWQKAERKWNEWAKAHPYLADMGINPAIGAPVAAPPQRVIPFNQSPPNGDYNYQPGAGGLIVR